MDTEQRAMEIAGTTRRCPFCAEAIRAEAVKCRYCGSALGGGASFARPWVRPREDRKIAGVCAGLAQEFGLSVTVLRLAFLLGFFFSGGVFLLVYAVLWIVMPDAGDPDPYDTPRKFTNGAGPDL